MGFWATSFPYKKLRGSESYKQMLAQGLTADEQLGQDFNMEP